MRAFKLKKGEKVFLENTISVMLKKITFDGVTLDLFVGGKPIKKDCLLAFGNEMPLSENGKDFIRAVKRNHAHEAEFYICTSQLNFTDAEKYENKINVAKVREKQAIVQGVIRREGKKSNEQ